MSGEHRAVHVQEGYNPRPVVQALTEIEMQKGYNPQPLAQTFGQLVQGETGVSGGSGTAPTSPTTIPSQGGGTQQE